MKMTKNIVSVDHTDELQAQAVNVTRKKGTVYLVGAGPGDPELITLKGMQLLKRAEVVVYDYLASPKLLKYVPIHAELIYVGKRGGVHHSYTQEEINQILVQKSSSGRLVVRLKGGDPFIFGRGAEEIEELVKAGIPFAVVPGVTSAVAAATYAGIPITHRAFTSTVAFITGHEDPTKPNSNIAWDKIATGIGTLVFFMGIKNLGSIVSRLVENGRDPQTPVAVVRWASTPEQQSVQGTLENIVSIVHEAGIKPPSIIVVGEVVKLKDTIDWFEKRPLFGKRIVVTRSRDQASELVQKLEELGANCLECSTISVGPPDSWLELDQELDRISQYDWLVFTSANGVRFFFSRLFERGQDLRDLKGPRIAVVGDKTALALAEFHLRPDLIPTEFKGEGLIASFKEAGIVGKRIMIARALKARDILPKELEAAGALVTVVPVYQNTRPVGQEMELRRELAAKNIDMVTFTSSSTCVNLVKMLGGGAGAGYRDLLAGVKIASIGPITSKSAEDAGLTVHVQPEKYTIDAMVEAIVNYYLSQKVTREPGHHV